MEARTLLQKMRQRGFIIKAEGNAISLAPKKLLNDQIIAFISNHKNELLTALYQEQDDQKALHRDRKADLPQGRLEMLRIILRRYVKPGNPLDRRPTEHELEQYLDEILVTHNYDIEDVIATYRNITAPSIIAPLTCSICECRPLFCGCGTFY